MTAMRFVAATRLRAQKGDCRQRKLLPIELGHAATAGLEPERARRFVEGADGIWRGELLGNQGAVKRQTIQSAQAAKRP
jgi:hypothetical protein